MLSSVGLHAQVVERDVCDVFCATLQSGGIPCSVLVKLGTSADV